MIMTALAMIIGMVPMALGMGEGGEQNAPLGRAVIGGLLFATVATLIFVPAVFALLHGRQPAARWRFPYMSSHESLRPEAAAAALPRLRGSRSRLVICCVAGAIAYSVVTGHRVARACRHHAEAADPGDGGPRQ